MDTIRALRCRLLSSRASDSFYSAFSLPRGTSPEKMGWLGQAYRRAECSSSKRVRNFGPKHSTASYQISDDVVGKKKKEKQTTEASRE